MMIELTTARQRVDHVFSLVERLPHDEEIISHWARYLCVLTSGLLENSLRIMLSHYVSRHANPQVVSYVQGHIHYITNVNEERLKQLLGGFSDEWRKTFEATLTDAQKDAVDSIVANRNSIAHGLPVGITINRVKEYYRRILEVLDWVKQNCAQK